MIDLPNFSYDCPKTWSLLQSGLTKGVFQCESKLVQSWLKKIAPANIWELSAVIALVRPGPLKSGFADDYVAYKKGLKEFESFGHPIIDEVFSTTEHVLLYQESLMALGSKLAFQHLDEIKRAIKVDNLRKGVGKKDQAKLIAIGKEFTAGCLQNGVTEEVANKLFEVIKNCGRYLFNLSHSVVYAHLAYDTAWLKANYPLEFTSVYLTYAQFKQGQRKHNEELAGKFKEIQEFIIESPSLGIEILPPNFNERNENFKIIDDKIIYGLSHIKSFGHSTFDKIKDYPIIDNWHKFFIMASTDVYGSKINVRSLAAMVASGSLKDTKLSRTTLLSILDLIDKLSPKELEYCLDNLSKYNKIEEISVLLQDCGDNCCMKKRKPIVESLCKLFKITEDHPAWIEREEQDLLGIALTATSADGKISDASDQCIDCMGEFSDNTVKHVNAVIKKVITTVTKKGKNPGQEMARIVIQDVTHTLDNLPVFPKVYAEVKDILMERNTVKVVLKYQKGWTVANIEQI